MITKNKILALAILILLIAGLTLTRSAKGEEIVIGAIQPFSGVGALYGKQSQEGLDIALETLRVKYPDLKLKLIYEDSQYNSKGAVDAYHKLKDIDNISAVIVGGSQMGIAVKPLAEADKILEMAVWIAAPSYSDTHNLNFRTSLLASDNVPILIKHLETKKKKRLAVLYVKNEFGVSYLEAFQKFLPPHISLVSSEGFAGDAKDFRTEISKIKATNPDALFYVGTAPQFVNVLKQAKTLALKADILTTSSGEDTQVLANTNGEAEGVVYPYSFDPNAAYAQDFMRAYQSKHGNKVPTIFTSESYVSLMLLADAIVDCEMKRDPLCWKNKLDDYENIPTILGTASFNSVGDLKYDTLFLKTIRDSKFERLQ